MVTGLWMVFGPYLGCGKTAFLVWLAKKHKAAGKKIFANFKVDDNICDMVAPAEILLMRKHTDCTILIDELWLLIDSRQSTSGENKFLNDVILSSRKRGVTIAGTAQMPHMVDKRFRDISDYKVLCERKGRNLDVRSMIKAHVTTLDFHSKKMLSLKTYRFKVQEVAGLYDTTESIEQDRRLYVREMAKAIQEDQELMIDLGGCETITEQRELLQTYGGVKRSLQVAILKQLGVR